MQALKLSNDRKVSPLSKWTTGPKPQAKPKVANSFGLPAGASCPGATDWCKSETGGKCYAFNLERLYTNVDKLVHHNLEMLKSCGSNVPKMANLLTSMVQSIDWKDAEKVFRWHWDGDVFSALYARAIAKTCDETPDIQHWLYTRSFDFVPHLLGIPNLTVYLSVDKYNFKTAKKLYDSLTPGSVMIAACADTWEESESIMRAMTGRNAPRCPELTGKTPLVSPDGKGACVECGLCIYGRNHVRFASSH